MSSDALREANCNGVADANASPSHNDMSTRMFSPWGAQRTSIGNECEMKPQTKMILFHVTAQGDQSIAETFKSLSHMQTCNVVKLFPRSGKKGPRPMLSNAKTVESKM